MYVYIINMITTINSNNSKEVQEQHDWSVTCPEWTGPIQYTHVYVYMYIYIYIYT